VPGDPQRPSPETVEWAKALVAAGLTDDVVAQLLGQVRQGADHRAEMAAWAFAFGDIPPHLRNDTLQSLLEVLAGGSRRAEVRGQVAEAVAEQLEFADETDPLRRAAEAALMDLLDDENPIVRFWGAFGLGKLKTRTALPLLHALTSDDTPVPRWWTVGQEAADAIEWIEGRVPPGRLGSGATDSAADPQNPPRAEDGG
jgi:hypothetical protein